MKIDLHVHSKFSKRPSYWVLQKIDCPESFTEPHKLYATARKRGMSLVTITDHNAIAGALEIAHLPNTFISEEVTTYFPEDRCKIHLLIFHINEKQHEGVQKARPNIFDLVQYLRDEQIVHAVAHPLYSINDRLTVEHFEKLLLLFRNFELNGARNAFQNQIVERIVTHLHPTDIEHLAEKHGIEPFYPEPWQKSLIGGSDDHSSLDIARMYTEIPNARTVKECLDRIERNQVRVLGRASTPLTLAHNLYGIAYQFYKNKFQLERHVHRDLFFRLLDRFLNGQDEETGVWSRISHLWQYRRRPRTKGRTSNIQQVLRHETHELIWEDPQLMHLVKRGNGVEGALDRQWFEFVNRVSNKVLLHFGDHLVNHLSGANLLNFFSSVGSAGALYSLLAPYFVAFSQFTKARQMTEALAKRFLLAETQKKERAIPLKVAHFTDTFYEINGVALTLQQQVRLARRTGKQLTLITCNKEERPEIRGVRNFKPIGVYELPEYPSQKLFCPPFLDILNYCYEQQFNHIHSATPGPVGLAALAISRILKLPINGTYHTSIPQFAGYVTNDDSLEALMWKYISWYYEQLDIIYVPSQSTKHELAAKGIPPEKVRLFPRGVDIEKFHPSKRDPKFVREYVDEKHRKLLYVGRVSKEKNLPLLADVFKGLIQSQDNISLIVTGDGPYLKTMQAILQGTPTCFTGYLAGEALARLYASCDLFVFPSTTDTFGNVVLEAQASGLPVVVTDSGGPQENILPGKTGVVVPADDGNAMLEAVQTLINHPEKLKALGKAGRRYMEDRSFESAFNETWKMYQAQFADSWSTRETFDQAV